jgi:hypothetical protein
MYSDIGSFEIRTSISDTFHFTSYEYDPSFKFLDNFIVKKGFFIFYNGFGTRRSHVRDYSKNLPKVYFLIKN